MNVFGNQKGLTLLEVLVSVIIIMMASTLFVAFMLRLTYQQVLQEQELLATNILVELHEEYYNKIKHGEISIPFTDTKECTEKSALYKIQVSVTKENFDSKDYWEKGLLANVQVEVVYGAKKHTSTSFVFTE